MNAPRKPRRGVAATEFAVCLPVMMLLLLGSIECCTMIFLKQSLSVAAYEAGHTALQPEASNADAIRTAEEVLAQRNIADAQIVLDPVDIASVREGDYFSVQVSAPADANRTVPISFFAGRRLSATAVFMKEI